MATIYDTCAGMRAQTQSVGADKLYRDTVLVGGRTSTDWDGWTAKANDRAAKRKQCEGGN